MSSKIIIIDSEKYGLSPAEKNFSLLKVGTPQLATLVVEFTTSFGYAMKEVFLNGIKFTSKSESHFEADVANILKNGDNKLVVHFDALQLFGYPLGQTTISAYILYAGSQITELPSTTQITKDFGGWISKNIPTVLAFTFATVAIFGSIAYISRKAPSYSQLKSDLGSVSSSARSGVGHIIMKVKK